MRNNIPDKNVISMKWTARSGNRLSRLTADMNSVWQHVFESQEWLLTTCPLFIDTFFYPSIFIAYDSINHDKTPGFMFHKVPDIVIKAYRDNYQTGIKETYTAYYKTETIMSRIEPAGYVGKRMMISN